MNVYRNFFPYEVMWVERTVYELTFDQSQAKYHGTEVNLVTSAWTEEWLISGAH